MAKTSVVVVASLLSVATVEVGERGHGVGDKSWADKIDRCRV